MKQENGSSEQNPVRNTEQSRHAADHELSDCKMELALSRAELKAARQEQKLAEDELEVYRKMYQSSERTVSILQDQLAIANLQYQTVANSFFWKLTKPFRLLTDLLKKLIRPIPGMRLFARFLRCLKQNGVRYTVRHIRMRLSTRHSHKQDTYSKEMLQEQLQTTFERQVKISVIVPLYNTPIRYLKELIDSVRAQTYSNWELCFADGSDSEHSNVEEYLRGPLALDERIVYRKLEKNLGISGNTNEALALATGEYFALLDHDDLLHPAALFEVARAINEQDADFIYTDESTFTKKPSDAYAPHFKPDFSPDLLRGYNYICHLSVFSRELLERTGTFRSEFDGSQDYDMILRLTEQAKKIVHIPKILYYWRASKQSTARGIEAKPYTLIAAKKALASHLERVGLVGKVTDGRIVSTYRIRYALRETPLVSILIPNMDHIDILNRCIRSVEEKTSYGNYEILIVENNSRDESTFEYYDLICKKYDNIRLIKWDGKFNFSAINNFAMQEAKGKYFIYLNNDIEIITPRWIEEMLMYVQRDDVGAAGAMLYYPDNTIQHAGVIIGLGGVAGHSHKYFRRGDPGYMSRLTLVQNLSAVTAACMMVKASVAREVGGFDEKLAVAFNDVDLCMKIRAAGYLIVFTPFAQAYHYESKSRGPENTPEKVRRFNGEIDYFKSKWGEVIERGDPYYNPNLTLNREDFGIG